MSLHVHETCMLLPCRAHSFQTIHCALDPFFTRVCDAKFDRTETNASVKDDDELMLNVLICWLTY